MAGNVCKGLYLDYNFTPASNRDIIGACREHQTTEFWKNHYTTPQQHAAMRRWGSYLRREARRRGLEF